MGIFVSFPNLPTKGEGINGASTTVFAAVCANMKEQCVQNLITFLAFHFLLYEVWEHGYEDQILPVSS